MMLESGGHRYCPVLLILVGLGSCICKRFRHDGNEKARITPCVAVSLRFGVKALGVSVSFRQ